MASIDLPSPIGGSDLLHVRPMSTVRSKYKRHAGVLPSASVLEGHKMDPSGNWIGLFLTGPRNPSGRRRPGDQALPPSSELRSMPHQVLGSGPIL